MLVCTLVMCNLCARGTSLARQNQGRGDHQSNITAYSNAMKKAHLLHLLHIWCPLFELFDWVTLQIPCAYPKTLAPQSNNKHRALFEACEQETWCTWR